MGPPRGGETPAPISGLGDATIGRAPKPKKAKKAKKAKSKK
jgi:hypothetical protein